MPSMRRRYEVWFLRFGLVNGGGAWWLRYLLLNPGQPGGGGCAGHPLGKPVQVWATWFPKNALPISVIQGFTQEHLALSRPAAVPFHFEVGKNRINHNSCSGRVESAEHRISWDLSYTSTVGLSMTEVGWIGFSRTPHSDASFSGRISIDGRSFEGEPLGFGLQGHNCGFRHRHYWNWTHCLFLDPRDGSLLTLEALEYEMPLRMRFKKAVLWMEGQLQTYKDLDPVQRDRENLQWLFTCTQSRDQSSLVVFVDGSGPSRHRIPYLMTDCSSTFEVSNNSLARARLYLSRPGHPVQECTTDGGAVLEMVG